MVGTACAGDAQEPLPGKIQSSTKPAASQTTAPANGKPFDVRAGLAPDVDMLDTGSIDDAQGAMVEKPLDEAAASTVIADQTITQTGRQFVHGFEQAWRNREGLGHVSIVIYERPSARWGSVIRVEENFALIYQVVLFPGRGDPLTVGSEAAQLASKKASTIEAERLLFKDQDLGADEL